MMVAPFPLIQVSGPPHDRGQQYGRQAAARIRKGIAHYSAQLEQLNLDRTGIASLVRAYTPVIEAFDPTHLEEMRGIASGADVELADIVLLNARTEILKLAEKPELRATLADGCTAVAVMPDATTDNILIHAQNWDWKAECAETAVVLHIRRNNGPDILTFTEAGGLARSGMNSAGIAITANYLQSDRDYRDIGVPLALIRRKVLQQEHLALAMQAVHATQKSAANNMMVSGSRPDGAAIAIDFECAPDEAFQVHPERGLLVHANHFVSPVALAKLRDTGLASSPCSIYRDLRVRDLLRLQVGAIGVQHVKNALFDDFEAPYSVARPPRPGATRTDGMTASVAMVVMRPALGVMEVCPLPALNRIFTDYRLGVRSGMVRAAE
jgi:isopenicillin-N N-acyltransferase-like protein